MTIIAKLGDYLWYISKKKKGKRTVFRMQMYHNYEFYSFTSYRACSGLLLKECSCYVPVLIKACRFRLRVLSTSSKTNRFCLNAAKSVFDSL